MYLNNLPKIIKMKWGSFIVFLFCGGIITFIYFALLPVRFEVQIEIVPGNVIPISPIESTNLLNIKNKDGDFSKFLIDNNLNIKDINVSKKKDTYLIKIESSSELILNNCVIFFEKFVKENNIVENRIIKEISNDNIENKKYLSIINSASSNNLLEKTLISIIKKGLIEKIKNFDLMVKNSYISYIPEASKKIDKVKQDYPKIIHFYILTLLLLVFFYGVLFKAGLE
jgi:hypothetical protein